jgi:hypothetical protein
LFVMSRNFAFIPETNSFNPEIQLSFRNYLTSKVQCDHIIIQLISTKINIFKRANKKDKPD